MLGRGPFKEPFRGSRAIPGLWEANLQVADGDAGHGAVDLQPLADHGGCDQLGLASWRHQERL